MIDPPALRPIASLLADWAPGEHEQLKNRLTINVKSQGRWACFAAFRTATICLLRPGVLQYAGSALQWATHLPPGSPNEPYDPLASLIAPVLIPAPIAPLGMMILDYDAHRAAFFLEPADAVALGNTTMMLSWVDNPSSCEYGWVRDMARDGCFPLAHVARSRGLGLVSDRVDIPALPLDQGHACKWVERHIAQALGLDQAALDSAQWEAPLRIPGWQMAHASPDSPTGQAFLASLAPDLHEGEIAAWTAWAYHYRYAALAAAALALLDAQRLEKVLPVASPGAQAPAQPARQRL